MFFLRKKKLQKLKTFLTSLRNIVQKAITTHFEGHFELYKIGLLIFPKPEVKWPKPEVEKRCEKNVRKVIRASS